MSDFRTWMTVVSFLVFVGICVWAWSGRRAAAFAEAERLPLNDEAADE